ncbi:unnamed protein product [Darwinula stevensoni]|uniref:Uncharacterized protein n=1 Tax=Darwinula stevensoni TaxID=69355 RepID=A0A7R9A555_9CRUS|nr:unnamed protein product [Darwinula stevensoni]CAG0884654.1 unnamed protein product [Darwinula stevensoni]
MGMTTGGSILEQYFVEKKAEAIFMHDYAPCHAFEATTAWCQKNLQHSGGRTLRFQATCFQARSILNFTIESITIPFSIEPLRGAELAGGGLRPSVDITTTAIELEDNAFHAQCIQGSQLSLVHNHADCHQLFQMWNDENPDKKAIPLCPKVPPTEVELFEKCRSHYRS